ncbi:uncharacterized protein BJ212DRAFT_1585657 [Suillus subaureus]|uniref:F-box domain-containing protein n=1 Tax=Suillus subaureus TaxID=48587 RepID=A0A9P7JGB7_9AGAM|nr:uncharacterized protein BJ212DRAFT_1585657 [Suillus subaureus]KAG1821616.1 hypothetical protein BJ212DRAFT_1585657 [Suillus subaureus]
MLSCPSAPASLFLNLRKSIWFADGTYDAAEFLRMTLDLGNQGIEHVIQLRALRSLCLDLRTFSPCERNSRLEFPGFHDLKMLGLSTDTFKRASNSLSSLQVMEMNLRGYPNSSSPSKRDATLTKGFTPLGISVGACRNLTRLSVERGCNISISDEELCQLVRDWPKLEALKTSCYNPVDNATMPRYMGSSDYFGSAPF